MRVRARKFPAVVNCTSIDWFHEWPEEALTSVSARFLSETEGIMVMSDVIQFFKFKMSSTSQTPMLADYCAVR